MRVADDDAITIENFRLMALLAGASLDCFFALNRSVDPPVATPLTDKKAIVKQIFRVHPSVRFETAHKLNATANAKLGAKTGRKSSGTHKQTGAEQRNSRSSSTRRKSSNIKTQRRSSSARQSTKKRRTRSHLQEKTNHSSGGDGLEEIEGPVKNFADTFDFSILGTEKVTKPTMFTGNPIAKHVVQSFLPLIVSKFLGSSSGSYFDFANKAANYFLFKKWDDSDLVEDNNNLDHKSVIEQVKHKLTILRKDETEMAYTEKISKRIDALDKGNMMYDSKLDEINKELDNKMVEFKKTSAQRAKLEGQNTDKKTYESSWLKNNSSFLNKQVIKRLGLQKKLDSRFGEGQSAKFMLSLATNMNWIGPTLAVIIGISTYAWKRYSYEMKELDKINTKKAALFQRQRELEIEEQRRLESSLEYKINNRVDEIKTTINTFLQKYHFSILCSVPVVLTSIIIACRFNNLERFTGMLTSTFSPKPDKVHDNLSPDESTYADTHKILKTSDVSLHKAFRLHTDLNELYYQIISHQYKKRSAFVNRRVLNVHLIRTDGTIRDSPAEIAHAIKAHWKITNSIGLLNTRVRSIIMSRRNSD